MACYEDTESMIELCKRSYDCPHHKYKFNMDGNNKTGCARVLLHQILHQILVFEESPIEELRYRIIAGVQYYDDIWMFLNMSRAVFKHADVLPKWCYGDPRSREKYEWFWEELISESIQEKVKHYASPMGAHKQLIGLITSDWDRGFKKTGILLRMSWKPTTRGDIVRKVYLNWWVR